MRRRMLMAQVIERELEEEEVARSTCISRFVNFLSSLKHDFPKWKFSLLWYVDCWGLSFSVVLFLYSCTVPTLYLNILCCQPASPLSPLWDIDSELTWHPHPLLPNFLFKKKKGNNDEDDIDFERKKRFMTFFWTSVDHSLHTMVMIMIMLMVIIIITFAKPLMTGTHNDYLRHVASGHQTHFRS